MINMENPRIEHLIEEYLLESKELEEGKKLEALLNITNIIRKSGGRGTKKGMEGIVWMIEKSYDAISLYVANSLEASAHITSLNKIGKIKAHNKKIALLQEKLETGKRHYIMILLELEKALEKKKKTK
jgi:hypothetical protein